MDSDSDSDSGDSLPLALSSTCPRCASLLTPETIMCMNGHTFCNNCRQSLKKCPLCNHDLKEGTRNFSVENICNTIKNSCPHRPEGCEYVLSQDLEHVLSGWFKSQHVEQCPYRLTHCPLQKVSPHNCSWRDVINDLPSHILESHRSLVSSKEMVMSSLVDDDLKLIFYKYEVFLYRKYKKDNLFYAIVQRAHCTFEKVRCFFFLRSPNNDADDVAMTFPVSSIGENTDEVFDNGLSLILSDEVIRKYEKENTMQLYVAVQFYP